MTETHRIGDEPLSDFLERIDWSYVKKATITKTVDGIFWAELTHYRSGKYMHHSFKCGRKASVSVCPTCSKQEDRQPEAPIGDA